MKLEYNKEDPVGLAAHACVKWGGLTVECVQSTHTVLYLPWDEYRGKAVVFYLARLAGLLSTFPDDALPVEEYVLKVWEGVESLYGLKIAAFAAHRHAPSLADVVLYVQITHLGKHKTLHLYPTLNEWYKKIDARFI